MRRLKFLVLLMVLPLGLACQSETVATDDVETDYTVLEPPEARMHPIAFHEQQLSRGEVTFAQIHDHVVLRLEGSAGQEFDTGNQGVDRVPFLYPEDTEHTICFEDDSGMGHSIHLRTQTGDTLAEIPPGECITTTVSAGLYHLEAHAGPGAATDTTLFIRPLHETDDAASDSTESRSEALDTRSSPR